MPDNRTMATRLAPAMRQGWRWLRNGLAAIGLLTLLVAATPLVSWWAAAYAGPMENPKGDVLIVLSAANDENGGISYSSYWRARAAVFAWQTGGFKKIVVSGGGGPGIRNFLLANGIPGSAIFAEWQSASTRESGSALAPLLKEMPGRKVLLTSDFHMYRALHVFRKVGVQAAAWPAPDVLHSCQVWTGRVTGFDIMATESAKIAYYRLRGWI